MTKRHLMTLRLVLLLGDAVAAWLVFLVVSRLRFDADPTAHWSVGLEIGTAAILFAVMWVAVLWAMGLYRIGVRWSLLGEARDIAKATVVALAVTLSLLFLTHQDAVSRVFLAALFVAQPTVTLAGRGLLRFWFDSLRRRGLNTNYMLVVGTGRLAQEFADRVEAHRGLGLRVVGHLTVPADRLGSADARARATEPKLTSGWSRGRCSAQSTTSPTSSARRPSTRSRSACRREPAACWIRSFRSRPKRARPSECRAIPTRSCSATHSSRTSTASWCAR